jgi:hypothetical protein
VTPQTTTPPGATLHLGGQAYANAALAPLLVPIDTVTPYPGNPRRHDQDNITSSIRDHGLYAAVVVQQSSGYVIVGNGRHQGLLDLGATQVPAIPHDCDDARAAAIVARDNRTSDLSTNDPVDLLALLQAFDDDSTLRALAGYDDDRTMALLVRQAEAADVFTVGTDHMADEFREISGQEPNGYVPEYARKTVVFLRDQAAIDDFSTRLGITEPLGKDLNYPLGWVPNDRRKRPNGEPEEPADA